jgi:hypothetical protein
MRAINKQQSGHQPKDIPIKGIHKWGINHASIKNSFANIKIEHVL